MCGIAGILNYIRNIPDPALTQKMLAQIEYRGPDESGIYAGENISMGTVRLSIIDLVSGNQPMSTPEKDLWIVFNGEIFNYIELRNELKKKGYQFRTQSDTEVLLLLYKEYKEKCLQKLNGQFAFAIWNSQNKELFLARDRFGIRPLFYTLVNDDFVFASEIKCLLQHNLLQPEMDLFALSQIFTFWTTLSPKTIFKNIYELPPGYFLLKKPDSTNVMQYWKYCFPSVSQRYKSLHIEDVLPEFEALLRDSVRLRLRADVPVAAYLSGGIDSSVATYFIKNIDHSVLNTYSIKFTDNEFDESAYQEEMSAWLSTKHKTFECRNEDIALNFPEVIYHAEIPLLRTGSVPMYLLSKNVSDDGIKVVMTGEGADEILGGYNIFKEAAIREFWAKEPESVYRPRLLGKLYPYMEQFKGRSQYSLRFFYGYQLENTGSPVYSHLIRWNNSSHIKSFFSQDVKNMINNYDPVDQLMSVLPEDIRGWESLAKAQWLETTVFMSGYLLSSQGDRVSMANSVEGRYPFLDHRLTEFCAQLPAGLKLKGLTEKFILKKLMNNRLPKSVINRPKQAYRAPVIKSFLSPLTPAYVSDILSERYIKDFGIFDSKMVNKLMNKALSGTLITENENMAFAGILSTQILINLFIRRRELPVTDRLHSDCRIIFE